MRYSLLLVLLVTAFSFASAQESLDGFFQIDGVEKDYSIYVPSQYEAGTPNRLMLGLHPLNPARWSGFSWRDTLVAFAEENGLLLVCPDGGQDGRIDDDIDTAFTSALLDSMEVWYSVDVQKVYAMGFSWGGRTTYTYGLNNSGRISGYIPIGAAINGAGIFADVAQNAKGKPFFLVHGDQDSPAARYSAPRMSLLENEAILNDTLMPGVGHTIDFPNRNGILTMAYKWVDSVNCANLVTSVDEDNDHRDGSSLLIYPNPVGSKLSVDLRGEVAERMVVISMTGDLVQSSERVDQLDVSEITAGAYVLLVYTNAGMRSSFFVKQ